MAVTTTNYELTKPAPTDNYDIAVPNANMDIIDKALGDIKSGATEVGKAADYSADGTIAAGLKTQSDALASIAGDGRTTETVKQNADNIAIIDTKFKRLQLGVKL